MSGTIRSRTEAQRDRHGETTVICRAPGEVWNLCEWCREPWPCPDRIAADDTLTDLNNAEFAVSAVPGCWWGVDSELGTHRLIPDPARQVS